MRPLAFFFAVLALASCGAPSPSSPAPPTPAPSASASASASTGGDTQALEAARGRARQLAAAAMDLRRANPAACPTLQNALDRYIFAPGTELDAAGGRFSIDCTDDGLVVRAQDGTGMAGLAYSTVVRSPSSDTAASTSMSAAVSSAERVVASIRPRFRGCYQHALNGDPTLAGVIHGKIVLDKKGEVKSVTFDPSTTTLKDPDLLKCFERVIRTMSYDAADVTITF